MKSGIYVTLDNISQFILVKFQHSIGSKLVAIILYSTGLDVLSISVIKEPNHFIEEYLLGASSTLTIEFIGMSVRKLEVVESK